MGWAGVRNSTLLSFAETEEFKIVITCDQNMFQEQDVRGRSLAVVELPTNRLADLFLIAREILETVDAAQPGNYYRL